MERLFCWFGLVYFFYHECTNLHLNNSIYFEYCRRQLFGKVHSLKFVHSWPILFNY